MLTMRLLLSAIICIPNFAVAVALQNTNTNTNTLKITPKAPAFHRRDFLAISAATAVVATTFPTRCTAELTEWQDPRWSTLGLQGTTIRLRSIESAANANTIGQMALYPDPILRRTASPVTTFNTSLETVTDLLLADMKSNAITALQYGIDARIIALKGPASPTSHPLILINPTILTRSGEEQMQTWNEYCLVLPPTLDRITVLRDDVVEVAAQDVRGVPIRKALRGEAARAFQHELDHLDGILLLDHAGLEELPKGIASLERGVHGERQRRAFERRTYQGNGPLYQ